MSNEDITTGTTRRAPRQGIGGSPVGSTLSIVLAVVAVIAGFLILRDLTDNGSASGVDTGTGSPDEQITTTTFESGVTTTAVTTTTTTIPLVTDGAIVVIANGNTIGGSAGRMSETLGGAGFQMGQPTNASGTVDDSVVYYDPTNTAAEAVARSVARVLGEVSVEQVTTPAPTENGSLGEAGVLVVLGNNQADKTLEQLAEEAGLGVTPVGTAPPVAGGDIVAPTTTPDSAPDTTG